MDTTAKSSAAGRGPDRRLLARNKVGRREKDRAAAELVTPQTEQGLGKTDSAPRYILLLLVVFLIGLFAVRSANVTLAPLLHDEDKIVEVAQVLAGGQSYLTYDLNIETRRLRHEHIANLNRTPYAAILGASHWQEAHAGLGRGIDLYNAHVHRDYYEDILAVPEMFVRYGKLPKRMIITIRDNLFTPVSERTDFLWVPVLKDYRAMAQRLGIPSHDAYTDGLTPRLRQTLSLPLLKANVARYFAAPVSPQVSSLTKHPTLDTLLPDGSIRWSILHDQAFTPQRAQADALSFAYQKRNHPPKIDEEGFAAVDKVLEFLTLQGVQVYLAHPPFNPVYWDAVQDSLYLDGLRRIERRTQDLARKYGLDVIGGFDPYKVGCRAEQYIDGEHSNPECLGLIIDQFLKLDAKRRQ